MELQQQVLVLMTTADWNQLLTILQDAYTKEKKQANADKVGDLVKRLAHKANKVLL